MKNTFCLLLLFFTNVKIGFSQFDTIFKNIVPSQELFKKVKGAFQPSQFEINKNGKKSLPFVFKFKGNNIIYTRPKEAELSDTSCSFFIICNKKISLKDKFINNFGCDLDVSTLQVYKALFQNKEYLLITGITNGSGTATTTVLLHLFDITNTKNILYFPLWSKFGSQYNFGDFNKDKKLDFVEVRPFKDTDHFTMTLMTKMQNKFMPLNCYKKLKYNGRSMKIVQSKNCPF